MAKDLRDTWKATGKGLGFAFRDLGKALVKTGATAFKKADNWANKEDNEEESAASAESTAEERTEPVASEESNEEEKSE